VAVSRVLESVDNTLGHWSMVVISGYVHDINIKLIDEPACECDVIGTVSMREITGDEYGVGTIWNRHRVDIVVTRCGFEVKVVTDEDPHTRLYQCLAIWFL
jgi:hypothetical protein